MSSNKNYRLPGRFDKPILADIFVESDVKPKPVLIYAHGFNGFKDWGNFDQLATQFAANGFVLIKFNFSHNGTTPDAPEDFVDLDAFAEDNYSKQLGDLGVVIDWAMSDDNPFASEIDKSRLGMIGHSRGGGVVIIKAAEDARVKAIATWASVSEAKTPWGSWTSERMDEWKEKGVTYITNTRTKQEMPLNFQLFEDYQQNSERQDVKAAIARLKIPVLICHGTEDPSVPVSAAHALKEAQPNAKLFTLASDHVFGRKHPWAEDAPPNAMQIVMDKTLSFFQEQLR
jgi:dienelactone hydrolase